MALFVMADLHLSLTTHKPMDIFGSRWNDHTDKIEHGWRERVRAEDTVVIPGDISWGIDLAEAKEDLCFLDALPGKKLIGRGNHDYWWATASKMDAFFAQNGITTIEYLHNSAHVVEGRTLAAARGWYQEGKLSPRDADHEKIVRREAMRLTLSLTEAAKLAEASGITKPPLVFLHFPPVFASYVCRPLLEVMHRFGVRECFYGHIHGGYSLPGITEFEGITLRLIAADYLNFYPEPIEL